MNLKGNDFQSVFPLVYFYSFKGKRAENMNENLTKQRTKGKKGKTRRKHEID